MRSVLSIAIASLGLFLPLQLWAQAPQPQPQLPTTVQLPTFRFFTVNTTVSVPDRGAAYLGGISRAGDQSSTRGAGPLRSRAISSGRSASTVSVHATIIDHAELDRAVLAEAARRRGSIATDAVAAEADYLSSHVGRSAPGSTVPEPRSASSQIGSLAKIREQAAAQAEERDVEVIAWLNKAELLEVEGKSGVAKIYYQMIARRATGDLKATATARIALIDARGSSTTMVSGAR